MLLAFPPPRQLRRSKYHLKLRQDLHAVENMEQEIRKQTQGAADVKDRAMQAIQNDSRVSFNTPMKLTSRRWPAEVGTSYTNHSYTAPLKVLQCLKSFFPKQSKRL